MWIVILICFVLAFFIPIFKELFGDFDWKSMTNNYEKENALSHIGKGGLIIVLICIFVGMAMTVLGFAESNGTIGTIGLLTWLISSVIGAYSCSPLRIFNVFNAEGIETGMQGCGCALMMPIFLLINLVLILAIMFASWVFVIKAIPNR